jgi:aquaporin Z
VRAPLWHRLAAECIGTAALVSIGPSIVILSFGTGSPVAAVLPDGWARTAISAGLFGAVGGSIALSAVGRVSGAHINPMVTLAFWLAGKMPVGTALGYVAAQLIGAAAGSLPLLAWGSMGRSVSFGATLPGAGYGIGTVVLGEAMTTFALISALCIFIGFRGLRSYTPFMLPVLYAILTTLEGPISGTSTNPARTLGPSLVSGHWEGWWIYWVGPLAGTLLSSSVFSFLASRIEEAKLYHFESSGRRRMFDSAKASGGRASVG